MVDVIDALQYSTELVGKLRALNKKLGEAEFKMLLADLTSSLGDAKLDAANLKLELAALKERNAELAAGLERREATEPALHEGAYMFGDDGRHYCTGCYDTRNKRVLLTEQTGHWNVFGKWLCPSCKQSFGPASL